MPFRFLEKKGLGSFFMSGSLDPDRFSLHISEIGPGTASHEPHAHPGVEALYVFEGKASVLNGGDTVELGPNDAVVIDPAKPHRIENRGGSRLRYLVIIAAAR